MRKRLHWPVSNEPTAFGKLTRSDLMARIRSQGNKTTEEKMARLLRSAKVSGWRRHARLIGKPDFVWRRERVIVFVDGCFWHGHNCGRNLKPLRNAATWKLKIRRNKARDIHVSRKLLESDWRVVRVWECDLARYPERCLSRIRRLVTNATRATGRMPSQSRSGATQAP
jgi:DNA mismatch endonuclease (patch repair protein)